MYSGRVVLCCVVLCLCALAHALSHEHPKKYSKILYLFKNSANATPKNTLKKNIKFCDIDHKNNSKIVDKGLKTYYNGYMFKGQGLPVVKEFRMNKLVKFLVALTDPEIIGAIGVVVGLVVACIFGGH